MKNIYRRNKKVYAHNPDPVVTDTQASSVPKEKKVKIPSGVNVLLGNVSFKEAFAYHKSKGKSTFSYKGEKYTTETSEEQKGIESFSDTPNQDTLDLHKSTGRMLSKLRKSKNN
mgnify:CR=1 FL=1